MVRDHGQNFGGGSFAPLGLIRFAGLPTACAVGCILSPLCGY